MFNMSADSTHLLKLKAMLDPSYSTTDGEIAISKVHFSCRHPC